MYTGSPSHRNMATKHKREIRELGRCLFQKPVLVAPDNNLYL